MSEPIEIAASLLFALAILHTFSVQWFQQLAQKYPEGSTGENFFHLMGEVEIVFGLWAGVLIAIMALTQGGPQAISYVESLNFTEPAFVFVIMAIAATRPIVNLAFRLIALAAQLLPLPKSIAFYSTTLIIGPLMGSFITEPAAMTVTALILKDAFFRPGTSEKFKYLTLAILFVNISIGGVLTPFAAPPVLMVASKWNWGMSYMLGHFGWKAVVATLINTLLATTLLRKELKQSELTEANPTKATHQTPIGLTLIHVVFLALVVLSSHHALFFIGLFLFFMGIVAVTQEYQEDLKLKESLLVGFFLAGLVVLGTLQAWWLKPLLGSLPEVSLFLGATVLTAFVDNAALTYLGTLVPNLGDTHKYALVAGAVAGGGLTIIANAPNPAGFTILRSRFGTGGINPLKLFLYALLPTGIAVICLWLLPALG